jgi:hypothetical protein
MKILSTIAIVLLCAAAPIDDVAADVVVPIESVSRFVNIRFAPDASSEVVGRLPQGEHLIFLQHIDGWIKVALQGGGTGYISEDWVLVIDDDDVVAAGASHDMPQAPESAEPDTMREVSATGPTGPEPAETDGGSAAESLASSASDHTTIEAELPVEVAAGEEPSMEPSAEPAPRPVEPEPAAASASADFATTDPGQAADSVNGADESIEVEKVSEPALAVGDLSMDGAVDYLVKFTEPNQGGSSQIYDNGRNVGVGTSDPQQRLEVNGNIQIHERNSNVAGLLITQSSGDTGYVMHNRASTLTIGAGSVDRITITGEGNVGFGVNRPAHPLEMASGAHVTAGGVWTNSSSIEKKENVRALAPEDALAALAQLEPVRFNYRMEAGEDYVGFIAEDVPALVATADRAGLNTMDIVAVLTSVLQQQQQRIEALERQLDNLASGD